MCIVLKTEVHVFLQFDSVYHLDTDCACTGQKEAVAWNCKGTCVQIMSLANPQQSECQLHSMPLFPMHKHYLWKHQCRGWVKSFWTNSSLQKMMKLSLNEKMVSVSWKYTLWQFQKWYNFLKSVKESWRYRPKCQKSISGIFTIL